MGENQNDQIYRIIGVLGLVALLAFTWWLNLRKGKPIRGDNREQVLTYAPESQHDHMSHSAEGVTEGSVPSGVIMASGKLVDGVREVAYEAFQYGFDPDPLVVYAGEKVRLLVKSRDVEHGMMIPEVDLNAPMPMAKAEATYFTAPEKPGEYPIFCSVFCGPDHGAMKGTLLVLPALAQHGSSSMSPPPNMGGMHGKQ